MRFTRFILVGAACTALAGCLQTDQERALAGAVGGAVVADALDENVVAGAAIGAGAGMFCDDLNVPGCRPRY